MLVNYISAGFLTQEYVKRSFLNYVIDSHRKSVFITREINMTVSHISRSQAPL